MANYTSIATRFYEDSYVLQLPPTDKLLFLYLISGPQAEPTLGIYELSLSTMAHHTGLTQANIQESLNRFAEADKIHFVDSWVILKKHFKHNPLHGNQRLIKSAMRLLENVPWHIKERLANSKDSLYIPYIDENNSLYIGYTENEYSPPTRPYPVPITSQSQSHGTDGPKKTKSNNLEKLQENRKQLLNRRPMP